MSADPKFSASRRAFLNLPRQPQEDVIRPPWSDEASVGAHCTGCNACVSACPETILRPDAKGRPAVRFDGGECTFCGKCADACSENVFDLTRPRPFELLAEIGSGCLQQHGISCQLCRDTCPAGAIRIDLEKRPFGVLKIETAACTACGACLGVCPQDALTLVNHSPESEAA